MILPILIYGHPVLKKVSKDIDKNYKDLDVLVANMFETMRKADGVGLAASQVGLSIRLIVIDATPLAEDNDVENLKEFQKVLINAEIIEEDGGEWLYKEGCLSVPTLREEVKRKQRVHIRYYDEKWQFHDDWFDGHKARIIQHEYDHLEGILFPDRFSSLKKRILKGKLTAISKGKFETKYKVNIIKD
ncbi:MAG: peptide deformylase [Bacteroidia bacterium]|nr:peptide deformylase [Bacteroidia bacterium]